MQKPRKPAKNSKRWFYEEWVRALTGKSVHEPAEDLAKLSYENQTLRRRLSDLENGVSALATATVQLQKDNRRMIVTMNNITAFLKLNLKDDLVMIGTVPHLHECALVQKKEKRRIVDSHTECTCGSIPRENKSN